MSPPPRFGVRKIQMSLYAISNWKNGDLSRHIQQRYLAIAVNYCTTNPSFGDN